MEVGTVYSDVEQDPGRWSTYAEDPRSGDKVEACVRHVTSSQMRAIRRRHFGTKVAIDAGIDVRKSDATELEVGVRALVDTRGFEMRIGDEEQAARYTELLGTPVSLDQLVKFDGRWTPALKEAVFSDHLEFLNFVLRKARELRIQLAKEEEFPS
jgi:hypothetical protein